MASYTDGICSVIVYERGRRETITDGRLVDVSSNDLPEKWARRLVDKGFTDRRSNKPVPSVSALAEATGLHPTTIGSLIHGKREPNVETVSALVEALGSDVAEWLGMKFHGKWNPPAESLMLTPRQRKALEELIVSMTTEGGGERVRSAAKTRPGTRRRVPGAIVDDVINRSDEE